MRTLLSVAFCSAIIGLSGCSTSRLLNQPFKSGENAIALIVYAENPPSLIETGRNGYNEPVYISFYEWFYGAFASHYSGPGVYIFDPNTVNAFATRHDAKPIAGYSSQRSGQGINYVSKQYHFSFSDSDLPGVFAAADDLGATHVVKGKFVTYNRDEHRAVRENKDPLGTSWSRNSSDNLRVEAEVVVTVFNVKRQDMLFQRSFSATDDRFSPFGAIVGDHNVRQSIATAVIRAIVTEEAAFLAKDQPASPASAQVQIASRRGIEVPELTPDNRPQRSSVFYPIVRNVSRKGPDLIAVTVSLLNSSEYPLTLRFDQHRSDRTTTRLVSTYGTRYLLGESEALRNGVSIRPGERADIQLNFTCADRATPSFTMEGDWTYSVPHYNGEVALRWEGLPNP